jgi:hypothetical protein
MISDAPKSDDFGAGMSSGPAQECIYNENVISDKHYIDEDD